MARIPEIEFRILDMPEAKRLVDSHKAAFGLLMRSKRVLAGDADAELLGDIHQRLRNVNGAGLSR